jgi:transglutaminase-like putative cysteine protease
MQLQISHVTEYAYSNPVFLEPHYLRFKPKASPHSWVKRVDILMNPEPAGFSEQIDIENNHIRLNWFEGMHTGLKISINTLLHISEYNPFNFLVYPDEYLSVPFSYSERAGLLLNPALQVSGLTRTMEDYVKGILDKAKHNTINFLTDLTRQIQTDFILESRDSGPPLDPSATFETRKGSCRDLAWMQIHFLRHLGIAARFVSGYYFLNDENSEFELHAWVEVYLPGAGWIGFDPSHGIITDCYHIPLASSAYYQNTMPVTGSVRGSAKSTMETELTISLIS